MGYIYQITNTETSKRYIGKTKSTLKRRMYEHVLDAKNGSTTWIHQSITKHGKDVFVIEALEEVPNAELKTKEMEWIKLEKPEYNMTGGGEGCDGFWITDGVKSFRIYDVSKIPEGFRRGRDTKTIDKMRGKRVPLSEEHKAKIKASCQNPSVETRAKISQALSGRTRSEEHKDKIRQALKGRPATPEAKAKMRQAALNRQANRLSSSSAIALKPSA